MLPYLHHVGFFQEIQIDYTTVRLEFNEDIIKATQTLKVSDGNSSHILQL